jgi:hypothetical protein
MKAVSLDSARSSPLSPEAEWNSFLELVRTSVQKFGPTKRQVKKEFSRLIKKQNPFAIEAQQNISGYEEGQPRLKASNAYEKAALYGITNLYTTSGVDSMKPKEIPYNLLNRDPLKPGR